MEERGSSEFLFSVLWCHPARSNKIYKSDAVFLIGETNKNDLSKMQFPNKIYRSDAVFPIGETNTNDTGKTQFPYIPKGNSQTSLASRQVPV